VRCCWTFLPFATAIFFFDCGTNYGPGRAWEWRWRGWGRDITWCYLYTACWLDVLFSSFLLCLGGLPA
jgi:hypothetical protein